MAIVKLALYLTFFLQSAGFSPMADELIGKYHLPNNLDIEIYKDNNRYYGKIIALNGFENGQKTDINNPDKTKRNDPLLGKVIIKDLMFDEKTKEWINGTMYGPEKGMIFHLKVTKLFEDEIEVVGSKMIFWRTLRWKKIS